MINTIDKYYKEQNVYDIEILSTLGLTDEDITALKNVENVEEVYGTYSQDELIKLEDKEIVSKVLGIDDVNKPVLLEGNLPQNINECVVEGAFLRGTNKKIGDTITIEIEKQENDRGEEIEYLKNKELKIVGTVQSPLYISLERRTSNLGAGQVNYYIYIPKENVNLDIYTEIKNSEKYQTASNKYEEYIKEVKDNIEKIKEERENARYNSLITETNNKIADAEKEFNEEKQNGEQKIKDAEIEIQEAQNEITKRENTVSANEKKANQQFKEAENKLNNAKVELLNSITEFNSKKETAEAGFETAENQKKNFKAI